MSKNAPKMEMERHIVVLYAGIILNILIVCRDVKQPEETLISVFLIMNVSTDVIPIARHIGQVHTN